MNRNFVDGLRRREFLRWSGAAAAAAALGQFHGFAENTAIQLGEDAEPPAPEAGHSTVFLRVVAHEADGKPLDAARLRTLHARDLANDALPVPIVMAEGRARIGLGVEPIQCSARLNVPGFGEVYCYADNNGKGYSRPENREFVVDAARTRLRRVREAAIAARQVGVPNDPEFERRLEAAAKPIPERAGAAQVAAAYKALANGLHAGERLALNLARHRISRFAEPRRDFLFGCNSSGYNRGPEYVKRFTDIFNYATISWYIWGKEEPVAQRIDYGRSDRNLEWCEAQRIVPKGFGYVYLTNGATPEWFRSWPFAKVLPEYQRIVGQTTRRYAGRMPYVEVINEAHDKANLFRFSHAEIVELTRAACSAAKEGAPEMKRLINNCCLWAEYAKRKNADGTRRWSPWRYLADCVKAGAEFEVVGLQLYYPEQDLFEVERMLDRFKSFGRSIQISEMGCSSAEGSDATSMRPKSPTPVWHGPWTESTQADWVESIYTLCYSKREFSAVEWWDLADVNGQFWPFGGLLRRDLSPKEAYLRLLKLQQDWGVARQRK
jgi:GH35 family endo-1,4-beta-xylanase